MGLLTNYVSVFQLRLVKFFYISYMEYICVLVLFATYNAIKMSKHKTIYILKRLTERHQFTADETVNSSFLYRINNNEFVRS